MTDSMLPPIPFVMTAQNVVCTTHGIRLDIEDVSVCIQKQKFLAESLPLRSELLVSASKSPVVITPPPPITITITPPPAPPPVTTITITPPPTQPPVTTIAITPPPHTTTGIIHASFHGIRLCGKSNRRSKSSRGDTNANGHNNSDDKNEENEEESQSIRFVLYENSLVFINPSPHHHLRVDMSPIQLRTLGFLTSTHTSLFTQLPQPEPMTNQARQKAASVRRVMGLSGVAATEIYIDVGSETSIITQFMIAILHEMHGNNNKARTPCEIHSFQVDNARFALLHHNVCRQVVQLSTDRCVRTLNQNVISWSQPMQFETMLAIKHDTVDRKNVFQHRVVLHECFVSSVNATHDLLDTISPETVKTTCGIRNGDDMDDVVRSHIVSNVFGNAGGYSINETAEASILNTSIDGMFGPNHTCSHPTIVRFIHIDHNQGAIPFILFGALNTIRVSMPVIAFPLVENIHEENGSHPLLWFCNEFQCGLQELATATTSRNCNVLNVQLFEDVFCQGPVAILKYFQKTLGYTIHHIDTNQTATTTPSSGVDLTPSSDPVRGAIVLLPLKPPQNHFSMTNTTRALSPLAEISDATARAECEHILSSEANPTITIRELYGPTIARFEDMRQQQQQQHKSEPSPLPPPI